MRKSAFAFATSTMLFSFTGCSANAAVDNVNSTYKFFMDQDGTAIYPDGLYGDGKEIFGNGSEKAENDIFTIIEKRIWGESSND